MPAQLTTQTLGLLAARPLAHQAYSHQADVAAGASLLPQGSEGTNSPDSGVQRMPFRSAWFRHSFSPED